MSLLTKKQRAGNPYAQVQTLVRIAKRAESKADWITTPQFGDAYREEAAHLRRKARQAVDEMAAIVNAHPELEWSLPQRRAAEQWSRGRLL